MQVAYAIGVAEPVGVYVNTYDTCKLRDEAGKKMSDSDIAVKIKEIFDLRPHAIVKRFGLKNPIFGVTASYGHFGRESYKEDVTVIENGQKVTKSVDFFAWEKLDYVDAIKKAFNL